MYIILDQRHMNIHIYGLAQFLKTGSVHDVCETI